MHSEEMPSGEWEAHSFTSVFHTEVVTGPGPEKTLSPCYRAGVFMSTCSPSEIAFEVAGLDLPDIFRFGAKETETLSKSSTLDGLLGSSRVGELDQN